MDQEEDDYSDRDASGEDDTDFVDANLSGRADTVALDPALAEQGGSSSQNGYHELQMQQGHENAYPQGSAYVRLTSITNHDERPLT